MLTKQSDKLQFVVCCETRFHRRIDKLKFIGHLLVILGLSSGFAQAQVTPDPHILESGKSIESKVAGGESHTYQISLAAGQTALVAAAHSLSETLLAPPLPNSATSGWSSWPTARCNTCLSRCCRNQGLGTWVLGLR